MSEKYEAIRQRLIKFFALKGSGNKLAESLGMSPNALRLRAARIRRTLESCVRSCLQENK
jgi:predicted kinase